MINRYLELFLETARQSIAEVYLGILLEFPLSKTSDFPTDSKKYQANCCKAAFSVHSHDFELSK